MNIEKFSFALCAFLSMSANAQNNVSIEDVFNGEMLNVNLRYFESVAGVPRETWGNTHVFQVAGCRVEAEAMDGRISSLALEINEKCQPNVASFVGDSYAPDNTQPLNFGNFAEHAGYMKFYADCLTMCGNAYDPSVYAFWEGPHAAGFINMQIETQLVSDEAITAADKWRAVMEAQRGEDYVLETKFACDRSFDSVARQFFEKVLVTRITLGAVAGPQC